MEIEWRGMEPGNTKKWCMVDKEELEKDMAIQW